MKRHIRRFGISAMLVALLTAGAAYAQTPAEGDWMGTLSVQGMELRILFKIVETDSGKYTATMDSIDQGVTGIRVNSVALKEDEITLQVRAARASYQGQINEDGQTISGTWSQGPTSLPLTLTRVEDVQVLKRPQKPKAPFPYEAIEVAFDNSKAEGVRLAGTLTVPKGEGPHPVVVFITGSGPQNRDEELMGHKPFLVISDYLSRAGIATLRYDDRGFGESTGDFSVATSFDFADDAVAAVEFLKTRKEIDSKRIGLLGHSEGGLVAPIVGSRSNDVAFMILLSGPAVTGKEIITLQGELIQRAQGMPEAAIKRTQEINSMLFTALAEESDSGRFRERVISIRKELNSFEKQNVDVNAILAQLDNPWFRNFMTYDPRPALAKVSCPILALFGENDLQVPSGQNIPEMEKAFAAGQSSDHSVVELPGLNHLYQTSTTGTPAEYGTIEETIAPVALETISNWIADRFIER